MKKFLPLIFCLSLITATHAQITIGSADGFNRSANQEGVQLILDSSLTEITGTQYSLDSLDFQSAGIVAGDFYLDVYMAADSSTSWGGAPTGTYLGSSSAFSFAAADNGDPVSASFSGINLDVDKNFFLVFSDTSTAGSIVTAGIKTRNADPSYLVNGGSSAAVEQINGDGGEFMTFDATFAIVPEPSTLALFGLAGLALVATRFRKK